MIAVGGDDCSGIGTGVEVFAAKGNEGAADGKGVGNGDGTLSRRIVGGIFDRGVVGAVVGKCTLGRVVGVGVSTAPELVGM